MSLSTEGSVTVTTTYLEIPDRSLFRPATLSSPDLLLLQSYEPLPEFYRFLYGTVGRNYSWTDRLDWDNQRLRAHLALSAITLLVLYVRGTPAGYVELNTESDEPGTEVAYFGLFPFFQGRGLGKHLLSLGVERAYHDGAERVWVHTCTLDGPHALANYQARGFEAYRTTTHQQPITPAQQ